MPWGLGMSSIQNSKQKREDEHGDSPGHHIRERRQIELNQLMFWLSAHAIHLVTTSLAVCENGS